MTRKTFKIVLVFLLLASELLAQQTSDKAKTVPLLFQMLEEYHYKPPTRNSILSNHIFDRLMKTIDPYGLFFTEATIVSLKPYRDSLCTDNPALVSGFVNLLTEKYRKRLGFADSIVDRCFLSPLNFSKIDSIILEPGDAVRISKDDSSLKERWGKWIKHGMLKSLTFSGNDSILSDTQIADSLLNSGSSIAKKSKIREKRWLSQLLHCPAGIENFVMNSYLNSITSCYDPHSNYFSNSDKEKFESLLSKENYLFGFQLGNNLNEEVIISGILPDSPLWYSKKLEKGDVLLKIKIPGQEETDLAFASAGEIDNIFKNLDDDWVELTIRKLNGTISKIEISKGKFDARENQTVGFILQGENPVGYIWFSNFYTEFNRYGNVGCSIDIVKEIVKLKESGIKGLIIDLRNNPGGSEGEAMEIAGYFTGNGPFEVRVVKQGVQYTLEKKNSIKWYDDPLVIMVNSNSASGSELLAAVLQDYNRAVIIGTNTFGKATEQYVFPIGKKMASYNPYRFKPTDENYGFVKLTSGKMFRITGKSYQKTGVTPDIVLPDIWENFTSRESALPFALENDTIITTVKFKPLPKLPVDSLAIKSQNRISKNEKFRQIAKLNTSMKTFITNKRKVPINYVQFKHESDRRKQLMSEFENINSSENNQFTVENTSFKTLEMQSDSVSKEINSKFKDSIRKDIYISEAFSVILDLLGQKSKGEINK